MRALHVFTVCACFVLLTQAAPEDPAPSAWEIKAAMQYVGLPIGTPLPQVSVVSAKEIAWRSARVRYIHVLHLRAVGTYQFGSHHIFLRSDWRSHGGMPDLVHEVRHYEQDIAQIDTTPVGGIECDAYAVEEEYAYEFSYPAAEIWRIVGVQQMLKCPIIFIPYGLPRP